MLVCENESNTLFYQKKESNTLGFKVTLKLNFLMKLKHMENKESSIDFITYMYLRILWLIMISNNPC